MLPVKYLEEFEKVKIEQNNKKLGAYGGSEIKTIGCVKMDCGVKNRKSKLKFYIVNVRTIPILGLKSCVELGLLKQMDNIEKCEKENPSKYIYILFEGLSCFCEDFNIELKTKAVPVARPARRIPLSLRAPLKERLIKLCEIK